MADGSLDVVVVRVTWKPGPVAADPDPEEEDPPGSAAGVVPRNSRRGGGQIGCAQAGRAGWARVFSFARR